ASRVARRSPLARARRVRGPGRTAARRRRRRDLRGQRPQEGPRRRGRHDHATDAENNAALLAALDVIAHSAGVTAERRGSTEGFPTRFRCVLALVDPSVRGDSASTVEGACEGLITRTPRGSGGFGYDPFFVVEG